MRWGMSSPMISKRRDFLRLAGSLVLAGCGSPDGFNGSGGALSGLVLDPAARSAQLEADVAAIQAQALAPGVSCGIWTPTSSWVRTFGKATVSPDVSLSLDHNFCWQSVTKSFTATLILQLVQDRLIRLEDPISRFVPGVPNGDRITLALLAGMSSGLFEYTQVPAVQEILAADPTRHFDVQELLVPTLALGTDFEAGSRYEYCNTNTLLLGVVVETVTGQPFEAVLRERILGPLGLEHTYFPDGVSLPEPTTRGYVLNGGVLSSPQVSGSALWAAGAIGGTLLDARRWAEALASGSLLDAPLQELRKQGRPAVMGPIYDTYGLGMGQVQGWYGHTGEGRGYAAALFGDPITNSQVAILMNGSNPGTSDEPVRLFRRFLSTLGWPIPTPADARP